MTVLPLEHETLPIPFDAVAADQVEALIDGLIARTRVALAALVADAAPWTAATLDRLDGLTRDLDFALGVVGHVEAVATTPALRAAWSAVLPRASAFHAQLFMDEGLYARLRALAVSPEADALDPLRRRYLGQLLRQFRRQGADLDAAGRRRIEAIERDMARHAQQFAEQVVDATSAFALVIGDPERLRGLPESALTTARSDAIAHGHDGWRITLHEPCLIAVLTYAEDRALREAVWRAQGARAAAAPRDNRPHVAALLRLRREKASLLGYADFADYVLEERMAGDGARAAAFVADLVARARPFFVREHEELEAFAREHGGVAALPLRPWDLGYWAERLRRDRYALDREALRPWFSLESVLSGLFEIAARLFGVVVRPVLRGEAGFPPTWHEDVRFYRVFDEAGRERGAFYADVFPRDGKRGGAWMDAFVTGRPRAGGPPGPHVGLLAANLSPPLDGRPALLTHEEVETVFHEFGHLLHHLLTEVPLRALAGTRVAWDFVELPSQIMENWCWERPALDLFARHWQSGEPIPDALFDRLVAARNFRTASAAMRQLSFAALDLRLHRAYDPADDGDVVGYARRVLGEFAAVPLPEDYAMVLSFNHLFAGAVAYAAGYYSYKWAEVLDADAYTRFAAAGVFDRATGRAFVDAILARGDSEDPAVLFQRFMGRDPDPQALLVRSGLA